MSKKIKIVFWGTPQLSLPILSSLLADSDLKIVGVVTNPDKPHGREKELTPSPTKVFAQNQGLAVYTPTTLKDNRFLPELTDLNPDICVVIAYGKIIPDSYLNIPRWGFINIHPSLLPKYRGPSPIQTAILNGDSETGISIIRLDSETDHGPILDQGKISIGPDMTSADLTEKLIALGAKLIGPTLKRYAQNELTPVIQNHAQASFTRKIDFSAGRIDWFQTGQKIVNQIRALGLEPGVWTTDPEGQILKILKARLTPTIAPGKPGQIIRTEDNLAVSAQDYLIEIEKIQPSGRKVLSGKEFINGYTGLIGKFLK
ncbi:MAG: methionyl-tRNA formyltransferase [Candidatus Yanofskybacteria bacterium CG10_big_fil_rev_8_21_14_0_10_46_23]|uniref:Methionyl-tRNA formyltransferase n=1 Tax=Candidatus Yanofskybacteria bacterium CG10_big_fil_rev_8_21_14_0_10_46_23 TaxID=1975098 RepID=A0A2H0R4S2_9BACT|nr:MAG: methionyl-tRNA formyltransferase [Candidatus Yanofskybacteria bacterium CG10_big_fil_rev_8_21_14_0_10_46_23]